MRDFFISHDGQTLKAAYSALDKNAVALTEQEWLEAEYDFNALFVGPQMLKARRLLRFISKKMPS